MTASTSRSRRHHRRSIYRNRRPGISSSPSARRKAPLSSGWLNATGRLRFRRGWLETGKGQAKSPLMAAIGLYLMGWYARIGFSDCSDSHAGIFNGLPQQWAAIDPTGVTIEIAAMKAHKAPTGDSLAGNTVILGGKTGRMIDADLVLGSGQSAPGNTDTLITFTATGAKVGDKVKIDMPYAVPLPAGVLLQHAYVESTNNVRLVFKNVTGTGQTIPAQTFKARIEGPW